MFTGIVAGTGKVTNAGPNRIWIKSDLLTGCALGASVAVDGVCLTVADRGDLGFRFHLSNETLAKSALGDLKMGWEVNIERPLKLGDELGGHLVQGHVDGVGVIDKLQSERLVVSVPPELRGYIAMKGSVTVDGVSLTVAELTETGFEAALVEHTIEVTTVGSYAAGRRVNIEVDVLAKYVEKLQGRQ